MSGKTYQATLVGADPGANLALLQLSGGTTFTAGTAFTSPTVGTIATQGSIGAAGGRS